MKKMFLTVLMLSLIGFGVFAQSGVIRELTGDVELKPAGAPAFVPAQAGSEVARDTIVSTGFKSTAIIAVGSSVITVRPLTRLSLAEIQSSSGSENLNVNLQTGRVRVDVKPPAGTKANCTVQSPSATASVRGTSFEFDTVNVDVREGTVAFAGKDGVPAMVSAGEASYIGSDGKAVDSVTVASSSLLPPAPVGASSSAPSSTQSSAASELVISIQY